MSRPRSQIAILGATAHIAKGLISRFGGDASLGLHLFARSPDSVRRFLDDTIPERLAAIEICDDFGRIMEHSYDAVINCIGVGTERKLQGDYVRYFTVTEEYDNLILSFLANKCPEALYITFSSGAVYGSQLTGPAHEDTINCLCVNHITPQNYYGIARLNAEAKHRAFNKLNIVDLRVFSYFSRFIDLNDGYFITDVMNRVLNHTTLETTDVNIIRDYVHPDDLYGIMVKCLDVGTINEAFDVSSTKPVEKREILEYFSEYHGLKYVMRPCLGHDSPTGAKNIYCSEFDNLSRIGYAPRFSSMESIRQEAEHILRRH